MNRPMVNGEELIRIFEAVSIIIPEIYDDKGIEMALAFIDRLSYKELTTELITLASGVAVLMAGYAAYHNQPRLVMHIIDRAIPSAWHTEKRSDLVCMTPLNVALSERNTTLALTILTHRVYKEYSTDCDVAVRHSEVIAQHIYGSSPSKEEEVRLFSELAKVKT